MFTQSFHPACVCEGDTITCEIEGFTATATIYRDDSGDTPEQRDDGFWPSLDPEAAGYIGSKSASELEDRTTKTRAILQAWNNDEWFYCGIAVTIKREDVQLTGRYSNALWGIECNYPDSDNSYLRDVANELLDEALKEAREKIAKLCIAA